MEEKEANIDCSHGAEVHKAGQALCERGRESEDSKPGCQGNCNSLHPQSLLVGMMTMTLMVIFMLMIMMITMVMLMLMMVVSWQLSNQEWQEAAGF